MTKHWLRPLEWSWHVHDGKAEFVHQWVRPLTDFSMNPDVIVYGAPLSRSSISVSGASLYPEAFRRMWKKFATYHLEEDVDLTKLQIGDGGDIVVHTTDISLSHQRIEDGTAYLAATYPFSLLTLIGGDHSVTACAIRGIKRIKPLSKIGILQLDTHLDVRDPKELGPANGTPIRQLIDGEIVEGKHVVNIGLHGFFNSKSLIDYAKEKEIHMVTLKKLREKGIQHILNEALSYLKKEVDTIYVTVDLDVLDISEAPGVPASTPGGMRVDELLSILLRLGKEDKVKYIDFVCLDPTKDSSVEQTVKIGVYAWLQFLTGFLLRKEG